ncbi:MAG: Rid family detoxifying hydrolase [Acidimicrobiia bacterium]
MVKRVIPTPSAVKPIGAYSIAAEAGGLVFFAGTVALDPATNQPVGGDAADQARRVMENIRLALGDSGLGFDDVVKTTVFLADMADFAAVNEVYADYFPVEPPVRSTVGGVSLPAGFLLEIEVVAGR